MPAWEDILRTAKILIIEDDKASARLFERILEQAGYREFRTTANPWEGLEIYEAMEPDLVLVDFHLPGMTGIELMQRMAGLTDPLTFVPYLMISADATPSAKLQALLAGAKDFLTKPIDTIETMLRIRTLLETRFRFLELEREVASLRTAQMPK